MRIPALLLMIVLMGSCTKQGDYYVSGVVIDAQGCYPGSKLVWIDNPLPGPYDFLCRDAPPSGMNCGNSVYITNIPASLAGTGQKVMFKGWTTKISCSSSTTSPNHIEVDVIKAR